MNLEAFALALEKNANSTLLDHSDLFRELCLELDVQALVVGEMGRWLSQPRRAPPIVSENTVRLGRFGGLVLDVTVLRTTQIPQVISSHQDILKRFFGGCSFDLFDILHEESVPARLSRFHSGSLKQGDFFAIDGSRQIFAAYGPEPTRFVSLSEFESLGVRHKFDSNSLLKVGEFAASPASTTIQLAARFLGYYGDENCVPALRHLLGDNIGAIQWEAACALTRVSRVEGVSAMKRLACSDDAEIARAAAQAVDQLTT